MSASNIMCPLSLQAFNVLSVVMKQRSEPGVKLDCKVLEVRDIDVRILLLTTSFVFYY